MKNKIFYIVEGENIAYSIVRNLLYQGHYVYYISSDQKTISRILSLKAYYSNLEGILHDPTEITFLESLDMAPNRIGGVISLSSDDALNFVVSWLVKQLYEDIRVISLVNYPENEKLFLKNHIETVSITNWVEKLIEASIEYQTNLSFFNPYADKLAIIEVRIKKQDYAANKKLKDLRMPENSIVSMLIRKDEIFVPQGNTEILPGDKLVIFSLKDKVPQVKLKLLKG
ncbi:potassium channel family protein [Marinitoga aeolica]|uniref:TrkA family potassium uptake protein n=1 Tax=Marinitoga aeolica TaxID=2809031 RepID=A0ABY8PPH2_9BACT|nr:TrkA C-terminal domain-containing protein [Marinitoga aeolica]WGS64537.1 TrkA family potassium uptake protein [Marinitoga aeolica]